eukprot:357755-Chlamydomonas_euryale.AAC.2
MVEPRVDSSRLIFTYLSYFLVEWTKGKLPRRCGSSHAAAAAVDCLTAAPLNASDSGTATAGSAPPAHPAAAAAAPRAPWWVPAGAALAAAVAFIVGGPGAETRTLRGAALLAAALLLGELGRRASDFSERFVSGAYPPTRNLAKD